MISIADLDRIDLEDAAVECGLYEADELDELETWQLEAALRDYREEEAAMAHFASFYSY